MPKIDLLVMSPPPASCESALACAGNGGWIIARASDQAKVLEVKEKKTTGPKVEVVSRHYMIG